MSESILSYERGSSVEKVRKYISETFLTSGVPGGTRLPPVREIAARLNVSSTTVDIVYKELIQEKKIETAVGRGTFVAGGTKSIFPRPRYCFALNHTTSLFHSPSPRLDWSVLLGQALLQAAASSERRVVIQPFMANPDDWKQAFEELLKDPAAVDGLLLAPIGGIPLDTFDEIIASYESMGKPVVVIQPHQPGATRNFVSHDLLQSARKLGYVFASTGRRRILSVAFRSLQTTPSNQLRLAGLQLGVAEAGFNPTDIVRLVSVHEYNEQAGYQVMQDYLKNHSTPPDAIYSFGDYTALGMIKALKENCLDIPSDVSVVGGSGLHFTSKHQHALTRLMQPFEQIGAAAVSMLVERVESAAAPLPGRWIPASFHQGNTTRPEENLL